MRRIQRVALSKAPTDYLARRQVAANNQKQQGVLNVDTHWSSTRQTQAFKPVLKTLQAMAGDAQRCMYCLDSHGTDVEHFRPKALYPKHLYAWPNLLLCCTECGRFKGNKFPMQDKQALLLNPTREDPWKHLDFDPATGNMCARFDASRNDWSVKGLKTIEVLQLDRREALSAVYLRTLKRLSVVVQTALDTGELEAQKLMAALKEKDDHGLLGWCLSDRAQTTAPFSHLYLQHPHIWRACSKLV